MAVKKDALYFYIAGEWRYYDGLKSAVNYFEKARELAEKDENTTHELFEKIYSGLICCYGKVLKDYPKALFYMNKHLDSNPLNEENKKAIDLRTKIQQEPNVYNEQKLLKIANNIRVMQKEDDRFIFAYIKYYILTQNKNCDEIFYLVAGNYNNKCNDAAVLNIKEAIKLNPKKQEYYDLYFDIIHSIISDCEDNESREATIKKYDSTIREILNRSILIKPTALNYVNLATYYSWLLPLYQDKEYFDIAKEEIKALDKSIELDDRNSYIFDKRAYIKSEIEDYDGAIQDFEKSLELCPLDCNNYEFIANLYIKKGEKEKSYQYLENVINKFSDNIDFQLQLYNIKIDIEYDNNDSDRVLSDCQKLIKNKEITDADKYFAYTFKAYELWKAGEYKEALETCDKIQKQDADTDVIRAYIYKKMDDNVNSEKYLNLAVEKDEKKRSKEILIKEFEYSSQLKFDK